MNVTKTTMIVVAIPAEWRQRKALMRERLERLAIFRAVYEMTTRAEHVNVSLSNEDRVHQTAHRRNPRPGNADVRRAPRPDLRRCMPRGRRARVPRLRSSHRRRRAGFGG